VSNEVAGWLVYYWSSERFMAVCGHNFGLPGLSKPLSAASILRLQHMEGWIGNSPLTPPLGNTPRGGVRKGLHSDGFTLMQLALGRVTAAVLGPSQP
jgi:hypothetical protein